MKWKLTGRYLISILTIVMIVLIVNTLILIGTIIYYHTNDIDDVGSDSAESFTRDFSSYMALENGEPVISEDGRQALESYGAWLQILDSDGHVVSSYLAPDTASSNYSPMEIVHKYKYMDDEFNTYFVGEYKDFSYIVGIYDSDERRFVFTWDVLSIFTYALNALLAIVIVNLIITILIGIVFSSVLTKPVNAMIERISQLKQRNFQAHPPTSVGIYKPVFSNLNEVSNTLKKHEEERQKLEKMRDEWISNVSHDIKTPLASIRGYAELLRDDSVSHEERLDYASVIERQSIYMKDLLDDFNLTMRLRNQEMPLHLQETRMETFVKEVLIDLLNDPQFRDDDISFFSEAPDLILSIDRHLMKRALLNFIYNALIHNDDTVSVIVTIREQDLTIEDNGKGIQGDLDQVFDRYYRGTNTKNSKGTGLGMAIARDIIEAHGAKVKLESEVGKGTFVTVSYQGSS
ncbi:sensor histidine kinase [Amphibacillus cookii]|uniref:sensor histidine kinase n=1 Tax=Amphibacillus cookii TaxID=767787 RepID=UPI001959B764|nr:HAMP domain-containing sensor histidine kinase [Amphibacillus cookii]MBM7542804.1 signal transduction histidine kinase [Amphibacillus cookii]